MHPGKADAISRVDLDEVIGLTTELAKIPSFTGEETGAARFLDRFFRSNGLESTAQEIAPGRSQTIARLPGAGRGRTLMLNGHLDIDPLSNDWEGDPWSARLEGDRLYGAGILNMKAGLGAMIMAAVAVRRSGVPLTGDVLVACVAGELQGGIGTTHMLESGVRADLAIVGEPVGVQRILTKQGGVLQLAAHVKGRMVHTLAAEDGVNAISKAVHAVRALEGLRIPCEPDPELPGIPRINIGSVIGGRGPECDLRGAYMLPDFCTLFVDVRFPATIPASRIVELVAERLERVHAEDPDFQFEIEFPMRPDRGALHQGIPPMDLPATHEIVETVANNVSEIAGITPYAGVVLPTSYAATDASHLCQAGIPACVFGPGWGSPAAGGSNDLAEQWFPADGWKWISASEIEIATRVFAASIVDVCR